jgi:hypothetical protein
MRVDNHETSCWAESDGKRAVWFMMGMIRLEDVPQREKSGKLTYVGNRLTETSLGVFVDDDILGWEHHGYAPGPSKFRDFVNHKCPTADGKIELKRIIGIDVAKKLARFHEFRSVTFRLTSNDAVRRVLADGSDAAGIDALRTKLGAVDIEVIVRAKRNDHLVGNVTGFVRSLMHKGAVDKLVVAGRDKNEKKLDDVNLIKDSLAYQAEVELDEGSGNAKAGSAVHAIREVYRNNKDEIRSGTTLFGAVDE